MYSDLFLRTLVIAAECEREGYVQTAKALYEISGELNPNFKDSFNAPSQKEMLYLGEDIKKWVKTAG